MPTAASVSTFFVRTPGESPLSVSACTVPVSSLSGHFVVSYAAFTITPALYVPVRAFAFAFLPELSLRGNPTLTLPFFAQTLHVCVLFLCPSLAYAVRARPGAVPTVIENAWLLQLFQRTCSKVLFVV